MPRIEISNLSFAYDDGTVIFQNLTLSLDSSWRLGLIGRNGRGKTTLLKILSGELKSQGIVRSPVACVYYPGPAADPSLPSLEAALIAYPAAAEWRLRKEASLLGLPDEALLRPLSALSGGEAAKVLLAALFAYEGDFLALLDEPAAHLDAESRAAVSSYLASKRGFIIASHDRALLDECADHVLAINRGGVELEAGNYSSWAHNHALRLKFEESQREKLKKEAERHREAMSRTALWASKTEAVKFGYGPVDRGFIGHKAAKMAKRAKSAQKRAAKAAEEKESLIRNAEKSAKLTLTPMRSRSKVLIEGKGLAIGYGPEPLIENLDLIVERGEIVAVLGPNGSGKTLLMRVLAGEIPPLAGTLKFAPDLLLSAVPQIPAFNFATVKELAGKSGLEQSRLKAVLSHLGLETWSLEGGLTSMSLGQLKKTALALSLCQSASLYLWDEPLSHLDIMARALIEEAVAAARPSMILVEHDQAFVKKLATKAIRL
ncbi:MAG: ATP-binding cassette domain-containing protein [Deltaproteobacteria bacterium]|jgi:lincosamide and streptogramin A transport system ATP-binding/permease protein|nr:ATP-binding cassette domain-containing protein [Deltaproteobacteria bacterium]